MSENLLDYAALGELLGKSAGALRVMKARGQLPEPDAPGPRWRRATVEELLQEGAKMPAGMPAVSETSSAQPSTKLVEGPAPVPAAASQGPPVAATSTPAPPAVGEDAEDRRRRSITLAEVLACPHPEDERKRTGYMTMCVRCGRRQTGPESWSGAGYAGWDASKLAACPHPESDRLQRPWGRVCGVCGVLLR